LLTTAKRVDIAGLKLPKTFAINVVNYDPITSLDKSFRMIALNAYNRDIDLTGINASHIENSVTLIGHGHRYTRNPLRWLAAPFAFTGDMIMGVVTFGHFNTMLGGMQKHYEKLGAHIHIVVAPN
jgi:hypothetical protein